MTLRFEGEFRVPGQPERVLEGFADVERMVRCMPGAAIQSQEEDGSYLGTMLVAFGPKKIKFKGRVRCAVDAASSSGQLHVHGSADMRAAARAEVLVRYTVRVDRTTATPTSIVSLTSDAELGGVLADFGSTGGMAVTQVLMEEFARHVAQEFSREQPCIDADESIHRTAQEPSRASPTALSMNLLLWAVLRRKLSHLVARVNKLIARQRDRT